MTLRIVIDIQAIQGWSSKGRGIGRYIVDFVDALIKRDDLDVTLLTNPRRPMTAEILEMMSRAPVRSIADSGWELDLDWYIISSPFEFDLSIDDLWPPQVRGRARTAAIAYDLIPLRYSDQYLAEPHHSITYRTRLELLGSIDLLLAISEATATDFREYFGDSPAVVPIGTGVPNAFIRSDSQEVDPYDLFPDLKPGYIMYTGGGDPRKNVTRLIAAYGSLSAGVREAHQLVLVYRLTDFERSLLKEQCDDLGITSDILITGYVADEILRALYGSTHLFVFPSLYEGFGLPIVEASLNGAPAIASDSSSMIELITDESLRFDPTKESDIAKAIERTLARDDLDRVAISQREYIASTFTWDNAADHAVIAMQGVGGLDSALPVRAAKPRPTVAVVGPLPPQHSGVADYMWRLLPDLAKAVDVVCVVEADQRAAVPEPPDGVKVVTVNEFEHMRRVRPFAETVIVMGNSTFHHYCWDLLNVMPAVVLAHELRYTGLFQSYASIRFNDLTYYRGLLMQEYGGLDPSLDAAEFLEHDVAADVGVHLVGPIIDRASKFLTTSEYAAKVARLIRPTRSDDIASVGFGYPDSSLTSAEIQRESGLLISIGVQFPTKRSADLVRTLGIVQKHVPHAELHLVGRIDDWYRDEIEELARETGVESCVSILGRVPSDDLEIEIRSADLAIQLRATSNAEVSAAIADCMVAGTPVVTTSIGAQTELADAGVELVDRTATPEDIAEAVVNLLQDDSRREDMASRGRNWAEERDPAAAAHQLLSALKLTSGCR